MMYSDTEIGIECVSREEIIRRIVERERQALNLIEDIVRENDPELHNNACRQFGTWKTALRYAGISSSRISLDQDYSSEVVKRSLQRLCGSGYKLTSSHFRNRDRKLHAAAMRHFGTWVNALRAAGIDPNRLRATRERIKELGPQQIIDVMIARHQQGLSIRWTDICCEDFIFARIAKQRFGNWKKVLMAAGLSQLESSSRYCPKWSREKILAEITSRYQPGFPSSLIWKGQPALRAAARRRFGNLRDALIEAGIRDKDLS